MVQLKVTDRQALREWDVFVQRLLAQTTVNINETEQEKRERVARLESNFEDWKQYYFPNYCYAPAAKFHKTSSKRIFENPEWYEVRPWARELAKDAVCMMETLNQALTGKKKNIILVSNSYDKAEELITPYRINLEFNERIINDYGIQQNPGNWTKGDFITTGGASFLAIGAGQSPRGSRNEEVRPDKIIISDIDTDEDVRNTEIIDKRWNWFERALFPTRSVSKPFQVIWLGNIIAKDCCVVRAIKKADHAQIINLEDKNGNSTWPEKNSPENIQRIKDKISTAAYQAEYMNNPIAEGSVFKQMVWGKCPPLNRLQYAVGYADPSPSNRENKKNSSKALFLIGELGGTFYIYTGFLDQATNSKFVNWFFDLRDQVGDKTQILFYMENNTLQDPFFQQVFNPLFVEIGKQRGHMAVMPDDRKKPDKFARIEGNLEPLNRNGRLVLNEKERNNPNMQRLEEQFLLVEPKLGAPADGPDSVEGGVYIITSRKATDVEHVSVGKQRGIKKY